MMTSPLSLGDWSLSISPVELEDAAEYQCQVCFIITISIITNIMATINITATTIITMITTTITGGRHADPSSDPISPCEARSQSRSSASKDFAGGEIVFTIKGHRCARLSVGMINTKNQ